MKTLHPKRVKQFQEWSKAMVAGAIMDRPEYTKESVKGGKNHRKQRRKRIRRMRRKQD